MAIVAKFSLSTAASSSSSILPLEKVAADTITFLAVPAAAAEEELLSFAIDVSRSVAVRHNEACNETIS